MSRTKSSTAILREAWRTRFGITASHERDTFTEELLCQLSFCKDDSARRLILGVSEKSDEPIEFSSKPLPGIDLAARRERDTISRKKRRSAESSHKLRRVAAFLNRPKGKTPS